MKKVDLLELQESTFSRFGTVLSQTNGKSSSDNAEVNYTRGIFTCEMNEISTGLMKCKKREISLSTMEKHDCTAEIMVNLDGDAVLFLAEPDFNFSAVNIEKVAAFHIRRGDAYVINPGVWHWASYPMQNEEVDYLIIFKKGTEDTDCTNIDINEQIVLNQ